MTPEMLETIREESTYHEAGHAIVMAWLKLPFIYVTVVPDEEYGALGRVQGQQKNF